jgi:hypothetical protein
MTMPTHMGTIFNSFYSLPKTTFKLVSLKYTSFIPLAVFMMWFAGRKRNE